MSVSKGPIGECTAPTMPPTLENAPIFLQQRRKVQLRTPSGYVGPVSISLRVWMVVWRRIKSRLFFMLKYLRQSEQETAQAGKAFMEVFAFQFLLMTLSCNCHDYQVTRNLLAEPSGELAVLSLRLLMFPFCWGRDSLCSCNWPSWHLSLQAAVRQDC